MTLAWPGRRRGRPKVSRRTVRTRRMAAPGDAVRGIGSALLVGVGAFLVFLGRRGGVFVVEVGEFHAVRVGFREAFVFGEVGHAVRHDVRAFARIAAGDRAALTGAAGVAVGVVLAAAH